MIKIIIHDTVGSRIPQAYRDLFPPHWTLRGVSMNSDLGPYHPHGFFCGWLAALPLMAQDYAEVVFVQGFDSGGRMIPGAEKKLLKVLEDEATPAYKTYVNRSWSLDIPTNAMDRSMSRQMWDSWITDYRSLQNKAGFLDFAAAGNSDKNSPEHNLGAPQAWMPYSNVIGSCNRWKVPSKFSGDGPNLQCLMWGEVVYSPNGKGDWVPWQGTSAATPKALGVAASMAMSNEQWNAFVRQHADKPRGWVPNHPKYGEGNMEWAWQEAYQRVKPLGVPLPPSRIITPRAQFHDMEAI